MYIMKSLNISVNNSKPISEKLYGIFFEDINYSLDGGMNNNQLRNASGRETSFRYLKNLNFYKHALCGGSKTALQRNEIFIGYLGWEIFNGKFLYDSKFSLVGNINGAGIYCLVTCHSEVINFGYNYSHKDCKRTLPILSIKQGNSCGGIPGIGVKKGHTYNFSCKLDSSVPIEKLSVYIKDDKDNLVSLVSDVKIVENSNNIVCNEYLLSDSFYTKNNKSSFRTRCSKGVNRVSLIYTYNVTCSVTSTSECLAKLVIKTYNDAVIKLSGCYFGDSECIDLGVGFGKLRLDLYNKLKDLAPSFIRFPGGCIVEGYNLQNRYEWKKTIGKVNERTPKINLWAEANKDKSLFQSYEIGFYEYFCLCELLNAEPLPILNAGIACQARSEEIFDVNSKEFKAIINDYLDLIEYANGDPKESRWAKIREESGHPQPFNLKMIGIGNENFGEEYFKRLYLIKDAIKAKYPYIEIVCSMGYDCYKHKDYTKNRKYLRAIDNDCIVDDHFYRTPDWVLKNVHMYDDYDRSSNRIFLGEYAANCGISKENNYISALAEAAFLTGLEKNADIVRMCSYAPLFAKSNASQWKHSLIHHNALYSLDTPNYLVQKLFSKAYLPNYIEHEQISDKIFSSVLTQNNKLTIKLVNTGSTDEKIEIFIVDKVITSIKINEISAKNSEEYNYFDANLKPINRISIEEYSIPIKRYNNSIITNYIGNNCIGISNSGNNSGSSNNSGSNNESETYSCNTFEVSLKPESIVCIFSDIISI